MILDILYGLFYVVLVIVLIALVLVLALPVALLALLGYGIFRIIGFRRNA